jgi:hypothetical protein
MEQAICRKMSRFYLCLHTMRLLNMEHFVPEEVGEVVANFFKEQTND